MIHDLLFVQGSNTLLSVNDDESLTHVNRRLAPVNCTFTQEHVAVGVCQNHTSASRFVVYCPRQPTGSPARAGVSYCPVLDCCFQTL